MRELCIHAQEYVPEQAGKRANMCVWGHSSRSVPWQQSQMRMCQGWEHCRGKLIEDVIKTQKVSTSNVQTLEMNESAHTFHKAHPGISRQTRTYKEAQSAFAIHQEPLWLDHYQSPCISLLSRVQPPYEHNVLSNFKAIPEGTITRCLSSLLSSFEAEIW